MHVSRTQLANANQLLRYRAVARPLNRTRLWLRFSSGSTGVGTSASVTAAELRRTAASCVCDAVCCRAWARFGPVRDWLRCGRPR